ncbi:MAG TPA: hypothetical protein VIV55_10130 [Flavobacterium sp.]
MFVELNIFCLKDEEIVKENLGINDSEFSFDDCILKKFSFIHIAYVSARTDRPEYTLIGSNNDEFICDENIQVVKEKIYRATLLKLN